jgi:predicted RNase H-like HicB family nuclease
MEYRVVYTPEADGRWNAEIPPGPGHCATWGRSLREARAHIRDALATALGDDKAGDEAVLLEEFRLPEAKRLKGLRARREKVEQSVQELASETADIARKLRAEGFSLRDIAELVGTSHQRVQQWVASGR